MLKCKNCSSQHCVKNGIVRVKQRYLCKECGYFVEGDKRRMEKLLQKKRCAYSFILSGQDLPGKRVLQYAGTYF